jgi:hypothetical protein
MAMIRREVRRGESFCEFVGMPQTSAAVARCAARKHRYVRASLTATVVPQIDQWVGKCLERIVHLTNAIKAKQQTPKLENHLAGLLPPPGRATELK